MMGISHLLEELHKLRKLKDNWYSVAKITEEIKKASKHTAERSRWIREAAEESGYSLNTLSRLGAVKQFYDLVREQIPELQKDLDPNTLSFPSLEVVKRLYQANQREGIKLLVEVVKGGITFRELRNRYSELLSVNLQGASTHQVARIQGRNFEEHALEAIKYNMKIFFSGIKLKEGEHLAFSRGRLSELPIDAIAYSTDEATVRTPRVGVIFISSGTKANWKTILDLLQHRVLFAANFLERVWIVFSDSTPQDKINIFCKILDHLDAPSVGIARLHTPSEIEVLHIPTGTPLHDWRGKLECYKILRRQLLGSASPRS